MNRRERRARARAVVVRRNPDTGVAVTGAVLSAARSKFAREIPALISAQEAKRVENSVTDMGLEIPKKELIVP